MADGPIDFEVQLALARAGSAEALGRVFETCRGYLRLVAGGRSPSTRSRAASLRQCASGAAHPRRVGGPGRAAPGQSPPSTRQPSAALSRRFEPQSFSKTSVAAATASGSPATPAT